MTAQASERRDFLHHRAGERAELLTDEVVNRVWAELELNPSALLSPDGGPARLGIHMNFNSDHVVVINRETVELVADVAVPPTQPKFHDIERRAREAGLRESGLEPRQMSLAERCARYRTAREELERAATPTTREWADFGDGALNLITPGSGAPLDFPAARLYQRSTLTLNTAAIKAIREQLGGQLLPRVRVYAHHTRPYVVIEFTDDSTSAYVLQSPTDYTSWSTSGESSLGSKYGLPSASSAMAASTNAWNALVAVVVINCGPPLVGGCAGTG